MVRGAAEDVEESSQKRVKLGVPLNVMSVLNPYPSGRLVLKGIKGYVNCVLPIQRCLESYGMTLDQQVHMQVRLFTRDGCSWNQK